MDPRIRIVLRIIAEQPREIRQTLAATSRLLGLSDTHLRRLFRRNVGMPLQRYLRETRMTLAANLVRECSMSIKEIALDSGYDDISNFYRDFREVHGLTPRQLRIRDVSAARPSRQWRGTNPAAVAFCKYCNAPIGLLPGPSPIQPCA